MTARWWKYCGPWRPSETELPLATYSEGSFFFRSWDNNLEQLHHDIIDERNIRLFRQGSFDPRPQATERHGVGTKGNQLVVSDHGVSKFDVLHRQAIVFCWPPPISLNLIQ